MKRRQQQGYTYIGVLLIVLALGMTLAGASLVSDTVRRREKEQDLRYAGQQYVEAIRSYYEAGQGGISTYPSSISELLRDTRSPVVRRHLRKPWRDPMTASGEWDLILREDGGIIGVRSRSLQSPLSEFPMAQTGENSAATGKPTYRDWQFRFESAAENDDNEEEGSPFKSKMLPVSRIRPPVEQASEVLVESSLNDYGHVQPLISSSKPRSRMNCTT